MMMSMRSSLLHPIAELRSEQGPDAEPSADREPVIYSKRARLRVRAQRRGIGRGWGRDRATPPSVAELEAAASTEPIASRPNDAEVARVRAAGGPVDSAAYTCSCGYFFDAPVSTSVPCPHCGMTQAW